MRRGPSASRGFRTNDWGTGAIASAKGWRAVSAEEWVRGWKKAAKKRDSHTTPRSAINIAAMSGPMRPFRNCVSTTTEYCPLQQFIGSLLCIEAEAKRDSAQRVNCQRGACMRSQLVASGKCRRVGLATSLPFSFWRVGLANEHSETRTYSIFLWEI